MQIFRDLLPWINLVPILSTVLAAPSPNTTAQEPASITKSVPDCAASPTEFRELPFQFWIETIFLKPYIGAPFIEFSPSNPVTFLPDDFVDYPNASTTYDKALVSSSPLETEFFTLSAFRLRSADGSSGLVWPFASKEFPGYSPLVWNANLNDLPGSLNPIFLYFTAVKKCTFANETELILRATRAFVDNKDPIEFFVGDEVGFPSILAKTESNVSYSKYAETKSLRFPRRWVSSYYRRSFPNSLPSQTVPAVN